MLKTAIYSIVIATSILACTSDPPLQPTTPPVLVSPSDGEVEIWPVTLRWRSVAGASGYYIQYREAYKSEIHEIKTLSRDTSMNIGLLKSTIYYWSVATHEGYGSGQWSQRWRFETKNACDVDSIAYGPRVYHTVGIGNYCWFKENLEIGQMIRGSETPSDNGIIEKYCYDDDSLNCAKYGGLYSWDEVMQYSNNVHITGVCPPGWYVPSRYHFESLIERADHKASGIRFATGFAGLFAGYLNSTLPPYFNELGNQGYFWSDWELNEGSAAAVSISKYNEFIDYDGYYRAKTSGMSVRCVKE